MRFGDYDKTLSEMSEVTRGMYMRYTVYINRHGGSEKNCIRCSISELETRLGNWPWKTGVSG